MANATKCVFSSGIGHLLRKWHVLSARLRHSLVLDFDALVNDSTFLTLAQVVQVECDLRPGEPVCALVCAPRRFKSVPTTFEHQ